MVRVLCKPYSLAGCIDKVKSEIINVDQASRAAQALQVQPSLTVHGDYGITSPPRCQSETDMSCDSDGDSLSSCCGGLSNGFKDDHHAELIQRRKDRRRERNKLSAQAYRLRKREEIQNQDKVVSDLEEEQKKLQALVAQLEQEKTCVETFLRNCFHSVPWPIPRNINNINNGQKIDHPKKHRSNSHSIDQVNGNPPLAHCGASQEQKLLQVSNQLVVS